MSTINFHLGDGELATKQYPTGYFDLAIVDVPYGIGESGRKNDSRSKLATSKTYVEYHGGDKQPPPAWYFRELKRISRHQIIFGANHFITRIPNADSPSWFVWDKDNGDTDYADVELAYTSFSGAARIFKFRWQGFLQGDMKNKQQRIHPNEKPIQVYKKILDLYAKPGHKIIDTHAGSLALGIACYDYGFDLEAWEMDKYYHQSALASYADHVAAHPKLF